MKLAQGLFDNGFIAVNSGFGFDLFNVLFCSLDVCVLRFVSTDMFAVFMKEIMAFWWREAMEL